MKKPFLLNLLSAAIFGALFTANETHEALGGQLGIFYPVIIPLIVVHLGLALYLLWKKFLPEGYPETLLWMLFVASVMVYMMIIMFGVDRLPKAKNLRGNITTLITKPHYNSDQL